MIDKLSYETGWQLTCNTCGFVEHFYWGNDWESFIEDAKEIGWRFSKDKNSAWEHYCPRCVEEYRQEMKKATREMPGGREK